MEIYFTLLTFIAFSFLGLFLTFSFLLIVSLFVGKSIGDPKYTRERHRFPPALLLQYTPRPPDERHRPRMSELYTTDMRNIEHVLKTQFSKYSKGKHDEDIMIHLFGRGIFAVNGEMWKQQRKLTSYEFSTRVLQDFSCSAFRMNSAKLVRVISGFSKESVVFDMQDVLMRCTLDSIFKVGFGVELNCFEGTSREGIEFLKAFDDSNAPISWRYLDPFWQLKRYLNIGCEGTLKKNVKVIDDFVHQVMRIEREHMAIHQDYVS